MPDENITARIVAIDKLVVGACWPEDATGKLLMCINLFNRRTLIYKMMARFGDSPDGIMQQEIDHIDKLIKTHLNL